MRLGLVTPILTRVPRAHSPWEAAAGPSELAKVAVAADDLGYEHLTCSEHTAIPVDAAAERGGTYWDPLSTFGFLAGQTTRIRFATHVLVLGYHHPLEIVKRYGTLDRISNGRLILGLGVGSLRAEFDLLDAPFDERGARADDALRALRAAWGQNVPDYDGPYYRFDSMVVDPQPTQHRVPMWVGGSSRRSLRRAVELADGWAPFGLRRTQLREMLDDVDIPPGFDVALPSPPLDPAADPAAVAQSLHSLRDAGATIVNVALRAGSVEEYLDQLHALAEIAGLTGSGWPS